MTTSATIGARTILIVDDSRTIIEVVKIYLAGLGFSYYYATDPREALDLVRKHMPDLLISDIRMPGMTGFDLALAIRADSTLDKVGILLVSGDRSNARQAAICSDGFVPKPIDGVMLVAEVNRVIKKRALFLQKP